MTHLSQDQIAGLLARFTPLFENALELFARPGVALSLAHRAPSGEVTLLGDYEIGDLSKNPYPNEAIARQKRDLSLRTGLDGARVPQAWKIETDSPWTGSVYLDGYVVACAGLTEEQDEMLAAWLAAALRAEARALRLAA